MHETALEQFFTENSNFSARNFESFFKTPVNMDNLDMLYFLDPFTFIFAFLLYQNK